MITKLKSESQILDIEFRKKVIEEICAQENIDRKKEAKKRYDIYKDRTKEYVLESLRKEFDEDTVNEMKDRVSNISFLKKVVDKKAMVYKNAPMRKVIDDGKAEYNEQLKLITDRYALNSTMKKVDKTVEYQKNALVFPCPYVDMIKGKWDIILKVLQPYAYDVIEDFFNPEIGRCYILSNFKNSDNYSSSKPEGQSGLREKDMGKTSYAGGYPQGDGTDQIIADSPNDFGINENEFIWWSDNYHFTTDEEGEYVRDIENPKKKNPIERLPFVDFAEDRDGQYWALGGDDLIDGSVLLNAILTDMYHIAKTQGMGIFYFFGKGIPKKISIGPNKAITKEIKDKDEPTPQIGFASSNPPIGDWMRMIEQALALLLSTNSLEPEISSGQSGMRVGGGANSAVQEMIRNSDLVDDLEDRKELYQRREPRIVSILRDWQNALKNDPKGVVKDIEAMGEISEETAEYLLEFSQIKKFTTEKEELEIIEKRRELMLDSMIDSMMRDNSELSQDDAKERLKDIIISKLELIKAQASEFINENENEEKEDDNDSSIEGDETD